VSDGFVSDGFVSDGFVSDGFVSDGFVSAGFVSAGFVSAGFAGSGDSGPKAGLSSGFFSGGVTPGPLGEIGGAGVFCATSVSSIFEGLTVRVCSWSGKSLYFRTSSTISLPVG
jgi:hypothetical protein